MSWKALVLGFLTIVVLGLAMQLLFLIMATGATILIKHYPEFSSHERLILLSIGLPLYFIVMFIGGHVTAAIAQYRVIAHCALVAFLGVGLSLWVSFSAGGVSLMSGFFLLAGVTFSVLGGLRWKRKSLLAGN